MTSSPDTPDTEIPETEPRDTEVDVRSAPSLVAAVILEHEASALIEDWRQLCRWDPELPPDADPPSADGVVAVIIESLRRPQPLGWGTEPGVAGAVEEFTEQAGPLAVPELVCLREAATRRLWDRVPQAEARETWSRLHISIDRAMAHAAGCAFAHLKEAASVDPLTGLLNRRVFSRDLRGELGRVHRHGGTFSVVILDLDGLKAVNDSQGHAAGDAHLQALASAMRSCTRSEDSAYRIGGDEFALLLPGAWAEQNDGVMERLAAAALPARFSWGAATCPADGTNPAAVVAVADARLYHRRAVARAAAR